MLNRNVLLSYVRYVVIKTFRLQIISPTIFFLRNPRCGSRVVSVLDLVIKTDYCFPACFERSARFFLVSYFMCDGVCSGVASHL